MGSRHNIPGYNMSWADLTPGIIRAGNNLSKLNPGIVWTRPQYSPWDKVSYDKLCISWGWCRPLAGGGPCAVVHHDTICHKLIFTFWFSTMEDELYGQL